MKILKQATYISHVIAKLSKFVQISILSSTESFLQRVLWKLEKDVELVSKATFFIEFFIKNLFCNITYKLVKFYCQTVFTYQVIQ